MIILTSNEFKKEIRCRKTHNLKGASVSTPRVVSYQVPRERRTLTAFKSICRGSDFTSSICPRNAQATSFSADTLSFCRPVDANAMTYIVSTMTDMGKRLPQAHRQQRPQDGPQLVGVQRYECGSLRGAKTCPLSKKHKGEA